MIVPSLKKNEPPPFTACEQNPPSYPPREDDVHLKTHVIIEALDDYVKKHYAESVTETFRVAMHMLHRIAPHIYDHHKKMLQQRTIAGLK